MTTGFNFDALLEAVAERVAEKLRPELTSNGNGLKPRLLSIEQAATYLGRTKEAVQHMVAQGKLPKVQADRRVQFDVRDLDQWIEQNKDQPIR